MQAGTCIALPAAKPATFEYPDHPVHPLHGQQQKWCRLQSSAEKRGTHKQAFCWVLLPAHQIIEACPPESIDLLGWLAFEQSVPGHLHIRAVAELRHAVGHGGCSTDPQSAAPH